MLVIWRCKTALHLLLLLYDSLLIKFGEQFLALSDLRCGLLHIGVHVVIVVVCESAAVIGRHIVMVERGCLQVGALLDYTIALILFHEEFLMNEGTRDFNARAKSF